MRFNLIYHGIKKFIKLTKSYIKKETYTPTYRLTEILQDKDGQFIARIQLIRKNIFLNIKPEEILAKDNFVDRFSPRDIRSLTYLGYLGINSPKYKILAQRLSENNEKLFFALKEKGSKKILVKSADEIMAQKNILNNLDSPDTQLVCYTSGSENIISESKQKQNIRNCINHSNEKQS